MEPEDKDMDGGGSRRAAESQKGDSTHSESEKLEKEMQTARKLRQAKPVENEDEQGQEEKDEGSFSDLARSLRFGA